MVDWQLLLSLHLNIKANHAPLATQQLILPEMLRQSLLNLLLCWQGCTAAALTSATAQVNHPTGQLGARI